MKYEQPFVGYYAGWDRCIGCNLTLVKKEDRLLHKKEDLPKHDLVLRKKAELKMRATK